MDLREDVKEYLEVLFLSKGNKEKDDQFKEIKDKVMNFEDEWLQLLDDRAKLAKLFDMVQIESAGDPIFV